MNALLIYPADGGRFVPARVARLLSGLEGVSDLNGPTLRDSLVACHYVFGGDATTLRLDPDRQVISLHGTGVASWQLARELQKREKRGLRVTDYDYSFDFCLNEADSPAEMQAKMSAGLTEALAPVEQVA